MAASMNIAFYVRGKCQNLLLSARLCSRQVQLRTVTSETATESPVTEYEELEIDEQELKEKIAKIRDCSGLNRKDKLRHHGKVPEKFFNDAYRGDKRAKLRRFYAEYGAESGINPSIMYPSRAELEDLQDIEKNWTPSFHQMMSDIQEKKNEEAEAARLRDEKIDLAMSKMDGLLKQYLASQKKSEEDEKDKDKTATFLDEFQEKYGYRVDVQSKQFKAFKKMRSDEIRESKAKQKKEQKRASAGKNLKTLLEEKIKEDAEKVDN